MRLRLALVMGAAFAMAGPAFADWQAVGVVDVGRDAGRDRVEATSTRPRDRCASRRRRAMSAAGRSSWNFAQAKSRRSRCLR